MIWNRFLLLFSLIVFNYSCEKSPVDSYVEPPPTDRFIINSAPVIQHFKDSYNITVSDVTHDGFCINDDGSINASLLTMTLTGNGVTWRQHYEFGGGNINEDRILCSDFVKSEFFGSSRGNSVTKEYELRFASDFSNAVLYEEDIYYSGGLVETYFGEIPNTGICE